MENLGKEKVKISREAWTKELEKVILLQGEDCLQYQFDVEKGIVQLYAIRTLDNRLLGVLLTRIDNGLTDKHLVLVLIQGVKNDFPFTKVAHQFLIALTKFVKAKVLRVHSMRKGTSKTLEKMGFKLTEIVYCKEVA